MKRCALHPLPRAKQADNGFAAKVSEAMAAVGHGGVITSDLSLIKGCVTNPPNFIHGDIMKNSIKKVLEEMFALFAKET